jgi:hypothetical protein
MSKEEAFFQSTGEQINQAEFGSLFGKPCFKISSKAFVCFFQNAMVFKLTGDTHGEALSLDGSQLFDPSGKKRPMKEWVQVEFAHKDRWLSFAESAAEYVGG